SPNTSLKDRGAPSVAIRVRIPFSDITGVLGRSPILSLASLRLYLACFLCVRLPGRKAVILNSGGSCCPFSAMRHRHAPTAFGNTSGMSLGFRPERAFSPAENPQLPLGIFAWAERSFRTQAE